MKNNSTDTRVYCKDRIKPGRGQKKEACVEVHQSCVLSDCCGCKKASGSTEVCEPFPAQFPVPVTHFGSLKKKKKSPF